MSVASLRRQAVLRIGEVSEVNGRTIFVTVDRGKNLSDVFLDGDILRNIAVNSFVEIRKGFLSIIGRVEGEKITDDGALAAGNGTENKRILTVSLTGYINESGRFVGGTKELPLIGNEAYIVTKETLHVIHNLVDKNEVDNLSICIASVDGVEIEFPVDGLFNSHIAIFGNTGSGKSNTLASLYQALFSALRARNEEAFLTRTQFVVFDFNGEYAGPGVLSDTKVVYNLSTSQDQGGRLPVAEDDILSLDFLTVLSDATDKTQKPFIKRALTLLKRIKEAGNPTTYLLTIVHNQIRDTLRMPDKIRAQLLINYFEQFVPPFVDEDGVIQALDEDLEWHNSMNGYRLKGTVADFFHQNPDLALNTRIYDQANQVLLPDDPLDQVAMCLYIQLVSDLLVNRAQNEHVAPAINKLKSRQRDLQKLFTTDPAHVFWASNVVVVNMNDVNLEMKKTLPLLLAKKLYAEHKKDGADKALVLIIDEAHNILSEESARETEGWKEYRLETFEELIKEGRKFGVFITISSQRPNDISPTITSQAHNYFVHRLINDKDLATISNAVSYIDKVTREAIPTLPTGTCIFSGVASQMPLKIAVKPLNDDLRPKSATRGFRDVVPPELV